MKRLLLLVLIAAAVPTAFAQVPGTLSYQGILVDNAGAPLSDGSHSVLFKFYKDPLGLTRSDEDFFRGPFLVTTYKGLFTFVMGSGVPAGNTALPSSIGSQQYYVGVTVDSDPEISPRISLTSVPYSFTAQTANAMDAAGLTGTVSLAHGGTGATDAASARSALGAGVGSVTNVTGSAPLSVATGTTTPAITISQANGTTNGYISSTDWTTFNGKIGTATALGGDLSGTHAAANVIKIQGQPVSATVPGANQVLQFISSTWTPTTLAIGGGTVTAVTGTAPLTVATGTTTPLISMAQANASKDGYLSSVDWNTFNNKIGTASNGLTLTGSNVALGGTLTANSSIASGGFNLVFGGAGKVGIGIAVPPVSKFDVGGSVTIGNTFAGVNAAPVNGLIVEGNVGIGTNAPTNGILNLAGTASVYSGIHWTHPAAGAAAGDGFIVGPQATNSNNLILWNFEAGALQFGTTAIERMRIDANGLVGIGTIAPSATLSVGANKFLVDGANGDVTFADDQATIAFPIPGATPQPMIAMFPSGSTNTDRMVIAHSFTSPTWGLQYQDLSDKFNFLSAGTSVMTLDLGNKRVGIGTITPSYPLHVVTPSTGVTAYFDNNTATGGTGLYSVVNAVATAAATRIGVEGYVSGGLGVQYGLYGYVPSGGTSSYGVYGYGSGTGTANYGVFGTANSGTVTNYGLFCSGSGAYTGTWTLSSDRKLKKDILPLEGALVRIMQLKPSTYYFRTDEYSFMYLAKGRQLGLIAQDVEPLFPEVVTNNVHPGPTGDDGKSLGKEVEFKGIDYSRLIPPVIKAIQEQQQQIEELKATIVQLKAKLGEYENLSAQVEELRRLILEKDNSNVKSTLTGSTRK